MSMATTSAEERAGQYETVAQIIESREQLRALAKEQHEALKHFADFPLGQYSHKGRKDYPVWGFNKWKLNTGHFYSAKEAIASYQAMHGEMK